MTDGGAPLAPGVRVAEFEILRLLGAGGFGLTYLARDASLACEVAVKEYFPARCAVRRKDAAVAPRSRAHAAEYRWGLERFLREARVLARFDDRRIVRVRRVFEAAGTAYLAMEYVEGRSLAAELKDVERLPEARVRRLMEQLTEALELVHAAGLVHRDIKPGNVMLRADGTTVLIDFGTANQAFGEQSELVQVTPPYAPIEQYGSGKSSERRLGPWTDIYALGAVAYRALSGQRPVEAVERVPVDRLPSLEQAAPGTSGPFAAAVMAALAVDGEDRPRSVAEWRASWNDDVEAPASRPDWRLGTGLGSGGGGGGCGALDGGRAADRRCRPRRGREPRRGGNGATRTVGNRGSRVRRGTERLVASRRRREPGGSARPMVHRWRWGLVTWRCSMTGRRSTDAAHRPRRIPVAGPPPAMRRLQRRPFRAGRLQRT